MIIVSGKLFGYVNLGTFHLKLPFDLPVEHFAVKLKLLALDISTGPMSAVVPDHSVLAIKVADHSGPAPVHAAPDPQLSNMN